MRRAVEQRQPYGLALVDMKMPGMNGAELARAIRSDPSLCRTRLILLTSLTSCDMATAQKMGFAACLNKPIRRSELYWRIAAVMEGVLVETKPPRLPEQPEAAPCAARVLLVEDNFVNQEVAKAMLRKLGCEIDVAEDGRVAVEAAFAREYDIVFMDCQMPNMDGFEATAAIRSREAERHTSARGAQRPRMTIVALTANAMKGDRERCLAAGMDDYLAKPFSKDQLDGMLKRWLKRDGAPTQHAASFAA
jgi:CheY-like chemotaxis protein